MSHVTVTEFTGMKLLQDGSGIELSAKNTEGGAITVRLESSHIMRLVEYLCLASYSINQKQGGTIEALEVQDAQTLLLREGLVAVEVAFGEKGALYLAVPLDVVKKLHREFGSRLEQMTPPPNRPVN